MTGDAEAFAILAGAAAAAAAVTWIVSRSGGRWLARRHVLAARICTALAAPVLALAFGIVRFRIEAAAHPGSDWPAMGLAGTIMIAQLMLLVTIPIAWLSLRRARAVPPTDGASPLTVTMQRDSVCMADDVDAPHERAFTVSRGDTLADVAALVAATGYLPMPSDARGWTISAGGAVVAIRPGILRRKVTTVSGDPAAVRAVDHPNLTALYIRPDRLAGGPA